MHKAGELNIVPDVKPNSAWTCTVDDVLRQQVVARDAGLSTQEAKIRRERDGYNVLKLVKKRDPWQILLEQFKSLIVLLLISAAILSFVFGDWVEGVAVVIVIILNAAIGFVTEIKAVRSMEALHRLTKITAKVRRNHEVREISADQIVPGDIVCVEGGDLVSADLRLVQLSKLEADESSLTGESVPTKKSLAPLPQNTLLADRKNLLFTGSTITRGSGEGVVVATGMKTEIGQISTLVNETEEKRTPLERQLDRLGRNLVYITLLITVVVVGAGIFGGKNALIMVKTAIALAVAAIPEGLAIISTIALARGMWRMAKRNALINRLSAVETLGATNIILTDKTGTLTENQMTATKIIVATGDVDVHGDFDVQGNLPLARAVEIAVLCNNGALNSGGENQSGVGDPMEVALLALGARAGIHRKNLVSQRTEVREEAFDSESMMMATFHELKGQFEVAVKGASKKVLDACSKELTGKGENELSTESRTHWRNQAVHLAEQGYRVLSLATKLVDSVDESPYCNLTMIGLVALVDPPRKDVRQAILQCQEAGIRVIMVTGDQKATALNVAKAVGLISEGDGKAVVINAKELDLSKGSDKSEIFRAAVFSRVSPKQKFGLVSLYQEQGFIVAMTGDGVNDAPALKKADIGIAMGKRGTQVAREAAAMVLRDDAFSSIVASIQQGRIIFNNIRKFVVYLLSCNMSEILVVTIAAFVSAPLPLLPLQILFLNLVTDVFPALALGMGEGESHIMKIPPRDAKEAIVSRKHWLRIGGYGLLITLSVLGAFFLSMRWAQVGPERAVTVSFLTISFAQLWHVFNMRDLDSGFFRNDITRNPFVWGALVLSTFLLLLTVYLRPLGELLRVRDPGVYGWLLILTASIIPLVMGQFWSWMRRPFKKRIVKRQMISLE